MQNKLKLPLAIAIASALLVGCSSNKVKEAKPNPLPKITQQQNLNLVFSQSVSSTNAAEALRLQLDTDNGVIFAIDPDGQVSAYKGKERLWKSKITKQELTAGVEAAEGLVAVGQARRQDHDPVGRDEAAGDDRQGPEP